MTLLVPDAVLATIVGGGFTMLGLTLSKVVDIEKRLAKIETKEENLDLQILEMKQACKFNHQLL